MATREGHFDVLSPAFEAIAGRPTRSLRGSSSADPGGLLRTA